MHFSETHEVAVYNKYNVFLDSFTLYNASHELSEFDLIAEFYYEQQVKINQLREEERALLNKAAAIRRKMAEIEPMPEKSLEWHRLFYELDAVEVQLIQINEKFDKANFAE